ncbi:MAG TPA: hypothetical protein VFZ34_16745, partial [Blastocatellia bacterium]|nr:hypothetical protein [Blastocatellia bacterium]
QIIANTSLPQRKAEQLISLATRIAPKDKPGATSLLEEAATILGQQVDTAQHAQSLMQLARAFAPIAPERSFELSDAMVAKFNTVIAAASVIDAFEMRNGFDMGEARMGGGGSMYWINQFMNNLMYLASIDFERTKATAERFDRLETRLHALVYTASGVLRPRVQGGGNFNMAMGVPMGIGVPPPPPPPMIRRQ